MQTPSHAVDLDYKEAEIRAGGSISPRETALAPVNWRACPHYHPYMATIVVRTNAKASRKTPSSVPEVLVVCKNEKA